MPHWKPSPGTIAARLSPDEVQKLLAANAERAPVPVQRKIRDSLGQRAAKGMFKLLRGTADIATLGLSELMLRAGGIEPELEKEAAWTDFVVGPEEACILILDGRVQRVITGRRFEEQDFWTDFQGALSEGPLVEIVMADLAPFNLTIPFKFRAPNGDEVEAVADIDVGVGLHCAPNILNLLTRGTTTLESTNSSASKKVFDSTNSGSADQPVASFTTHANLAQRLDRRLNQRAGASLGAQGDINAAATDVQLLRKLEKALWDLVNADLNPFGIEAQRVTLLLGTTPQQKLDFERRRLELDAQRNDMLSGAERIEKDRKAEIEKQRQKREHDLTEHLAALQHQGSKAGAARDLELGRMGLLDEQDLWRLENEGARERTQAQREEAQRQLEADLLTGRQQHAADLEKQLAGARNDVEIERLRMQLERERLEIARIAQDQNLRNLDRIKQIEREDEIAREKATFSNVAGVTGEQALIAMIKSNPAAAEALKAKFAAEGQARAAESAARGNEDKVKLVQENQAQMTDLMKSALQANAAVAGAAAEPSCPDCGKAVKATFKVCPYCGTKMTRA